MRRFSGVVVASFVALSAGQAGAVSLFPATGDPQDSVYGQITQPRNDDDSSERLDLPFSLNFFGTNYNKFWVNNNGNVSFNGPLSTFTPNPFPQSNQPLIAPWWADVDTRNLASGLVYIGTLEVSNRTAVAVTWNDVGYFSNAVNKTNNFQLVLIDRNDTGAGNFDIEFRYDRLEWTTGSASGGSNGLGGVPAQAGYDAGDGVNFFTLPGSRTGDVLNLATTSNVSLATPGLWYFQIRNGEITDGSTAETPLLPNVVTDAGFVFDFNVGDITQRVFIDPFVAVGYDFVATGTNFATGLFPELGDADGYEIYGWDGADYTILLGTVLGGDVFDFGAGGLARFGLRDIEPGLGLDPEDPTAFVSGFTFTSTGRVNVVQTPISVFVPGPDNVVPEPATWAMMIAGFGLVGAAARRRRLRAA
jgi:hypothetical protein